MSETWITIENPTNTSIATGQYADGGRQIAFVPGRPDKPRRRKHARMIAAAPDLLEALEMVRDADEDCKRDGLPTIPSPARMKIDHAIAKATPPAEPALSPLSSTEPPAPPAPGTHGTSPASKQGSPDTPDGCGTC